MVCNLLETAAECMERDVAMVTTLTHCENHRWTSPLVLCDQLLSMAEKADEAGFRRIDYYGPGPVNRQEWCTSLFVKSLDVFADSIDSPQGDCDLGW